MRCKILKYRSSASMFGEGLCDCAALPWKLRGALQILKKRSAVSMFVFGEGPKFSCTLWEGPSTIAVSMFFFGGGKP